MTFGQAVDVMTGGGCVTRTGWEVPRGSLRMAPLERYGLRMFYTRGKGEWYWTPTQTDLLSNDWFELPASAG